MSFKGYKLKFELHAGHSNIDGKSDNIHFHTFTIVLYLNDLNEDMDFFNDTEKEVNEWLQPFQNKILSNTDMFRDKSTTIESIGDTFYEQWIDKAKELSFELLRLEIFENPVRTYSVSHKILDEDVNEIGAMPYSFVETIEFDNRKDENLEVAVTTENKINSEEILIKDSEDEEILDSKDVISDIELNIDSENSIKKPTIKQIFLKNLKFIGGLILFVLISIGIMCSIKISGNYPQGSDTLCHIYRADVLLNNIIDGNWYPLYDNMWYNGVEIMRYWAPAPLYILAGCEVIAGSMLDGYIAFVGLIFLAGAIGWLLIGRKIDRIGLSIFVGIVWFFLPENMRLIILDGNLPRVVINTALPFLLLFVLKLMEEKKWTNIIPITFIIAFIGLCHIGIAIMLIVTLLIFLLIYGKKNNCYHEVGMVVVSAVIGLMITGLWLIPSLNGSGLGNSDGGNQVMKLFFESTFVSLNPIPRWNGDLSVFYYGLSIFIICLLGIFLGDKKTIPGFMTGLIIFLCTTESVYYLFEKLPFSQYLWMIRFVPISFAFVMISILLWKDLRKYVVVIIGVLLLLDCIPSYRYIYEEKANRVENVEEYQYETGKKLLINEAKDITVQRMAIFDLSTYGAFAPYYVTGVENKVQYMFGAGWEGARIAKNIVMLNEAIDNGRYYYVFDRSIELGADTLLFDITCLKNKERDVDKLIQEGKKIGYEVIRTTEKTILFHKDVEGSFGVITEYDNIAIGNVARYIATIYPTFKEGDSYNVNDYTVEELSKYKIIYLSDFTYDDKESAEKLLEEVSNNGTKIYIDMNKVPVNIETNLQEIFGVQVQTITFSDNFPAIYYNDEKYKTSGFTTDGGKWKANYLIGINEVTGYSDINGTEISFSGTNDNKNIVFLGYNFVYYVEANHDIIGLGLLSSIFDLEVGETPDRQIVPIEVTYNDREIIIDSEYDNVNTTLANIDIFSSDKEYTEENSLIVVNKGNTVIDMNYPYFIEGLMLSISGFVGLIGYIVYLRKRAKSKVVSD